MNKDKASLVTEATLWHLYRKLLGGRMLERHLAPLPRRSAPEVSTAVASALAVNLQTGDTLGLSPVDTTTRYLCGMPLQVIRTAATDRSRSRKPTGADPACPWAIEADADHGILPGTGSLQAGLATGAALAARLHATESLTVLVRSLAANAPGDARLTPSPDWAQAAALAVALQLPLLFITDSHAGLQRAAAGPTTAALELPVISVDRCDALALYRVIYEAAARARSGGGPTWVEAREWTTATPRGKRQAACSDPVTVLGQALRSRDLFDRDRERLLERGLQKEFLQSGWSGMDSG